MGTKHWRERKRVSQHSVCTESCCKTQLTLQQRARATAVQAEQHQRGNTKHQPHTTASLVNHLYGLHEQHFIFFTFWPCRFESDAGARCFAAFLVIMDSMTGFYMDTASTSLAKPVKLEPTSLIWVCSTSILASNYVSMPPLTSLMHNRLMPLVHYCDNVRERKTCKDKV